VFNEIALEKSSSPQQYSLHTSIRQQTSVLIIATRVQHGVKEMLFNNW